MDELGASGVPCTRHLMVRLGISPADVAVVQRVARTPIDEAAVNKWYARTSDEKGGELKDAIVGDTVAAICQARIEAHAVFPTGHFTASGKQLVVRLGQDGVFRAREDGAGASLFPREAGDGKSRCSPGALHSFWPKDFLYTNGLCIPGLGPPSGSLHPPPVSSILLAPASFSNLKSLRSTKPGELLSVVSTHRVMSRCCCRTASGVWRTRRLSWASIRAAYTITSAL